VGVGQVTAPSRLSSEGVRLWIAEPSFTSSTPRRALGVTSRSRSWHDGIAEVWRSVIRNGSDQPDGEDREERVLVFSVRPYAGDAGRCSRCLRPCPDYNAGARGCGGVGEGPAWKRDGS